LAARRAGARRGTALDGPPPLAQFGIVNSELRRKKETQPRFFRYPEATSVLLYRGRERLRVGEVWCLPVEEFLRGFIPDGPLLPLTG